MLIESRIKDGFMKSLGGFFRFAVIVSIPFSPGVFYFFRIEQPEIYVTDFFFPTFLLGICTLLFLAGRWYISKLKSMNFEND
jgi:hypothetical protein